MRDVVACVVTDGDLVCLVRRSEDVGHDRGRWHCVTGYVERGRSPLDTVQAELSEELGLEDDAIDELVAGPLLRLHENGTLWRVHVFAARTSQEMFRLNWENDAYVWTPPDHSLAGCVSWLGKVYESVLPRVCLSPALTATW